MFICVLTLSPSIIGSQNYPQEMVTVIVEGLSVDVVLFSELIKRLDQGKTDEVREELCAFLKAKIGVYRDFLKEIPEIDQELKQGMVNRSLESIANDGPECGFDEEIELFLRQFK